ncbi:hypothetical protein HT031_000595 [Scenedesmus sp. PABB004]|nr:hypothetical protein HT031_000595 [Scenedesmus sp. PABB004]
MRPARLRASRAAPAGSGGCGGGGSSVRPPLPLPEAPCVQPRRQQQPRQQPHQQQQPQAVAPVADACAGSRRGLLLGAGAAALAAAAGARPAAASITVTLRPKAQLKEFTLKAGYRVTVPDDWALAYDRSDTPELGTKSFWGNFRTFETLAISRLDLPPGEQPSPEALLAASLAEQRNNQSTFGFELLSGPSPTPRAEGGVTFYDSEFVLAVCRGLAVEGSGGRRRCVGPRDMDLQVVSRHFCQTLVCSGGSIYVVRGSATEEAWPEVGPAAVAAVRSFRLPPA